MTTIQHIDPRVERTRIAVIEAAAELLTTDGPAAVTHTSVAAAANISRTTVYNHWPTREDLLRATIDSIATAVPAVEELTGSFREDLSILCGPMIQHLVDDQRAPLVVSMLERALHDDAVAAIRDEYLAAFNEVFELVIGTAIENGDLRADIDVARSGASIFGSFLFLRFMSSSGFTTADADAVIDDFVLVNAPR